MRFVLALSLTLAVTVAAAEPGEPVPWNEARAHVGTIVIVEGFVREVRREERRLTLLFDPDDVRALRVTLLIPLITDLPPEPEALYRERRVQVQGRITRTAGHLDMIVTDPDRITVAGLTPKTPPARDTPPTRDAEVSPQATTADEPAAVPPVSAPDAPRPAAPAEPSPPDAVAARAEAACARLAASRDAARRDALDAVQTLRACLEASAVGCIAAADAIAPPVSRLEWTEQELRARCPAGR